jgi:hypothetical protein
VLPELPDVTLVDEPELAVFTPVGPESPETPVGPLVAVLTLVALPAAPELPPTPPTASAEVSPPTVASPLCDEEFPPPAVTLPDEAELEPVADAFPLPPFPPLPESPPVVAEWLLASPLEPVFPVLPELPELT